LLRCLRLVGLTLPNSLKYFNCSHNRITSFSGLILPGSLGGFVCSNNKIKSFKSEDGEAGLTLPPSLTYFDCSDNQIASFESEDNEAGLIVSTSIKIFDCSHNKMILIRNIEFPSSLSIFHVDKSVKFIDPKFNTVLETKLNNNVEFTRLNKNHSIFAYLNFRSISLHQYNQLLDNIKIGDI
jgi:Leucine-rich repeat (LRR) protein